MCGICGEIRYMTGKAETATVERMSEVLAPRGPDAAACFSQDGVAFGHRRLKIIDLSEKAAQPMIDSDLSLVIVYNGAIYNYRDLRAELEGKGYKFFSDGDTEVVLKAYHAWGERCVHKLSGMFAFGISNLETKRVFLARDRLGIKPLYYSEIPSGLRFASSLPALLAAGEVDTEIDPVALHHYMTFHAVVPAPHTILKGVRKLPPATTMTIEPDGTKRLKTYWELSFQADAEEANYSFDEWKCLLGSALRLSVHRRLVADVPVGVLLSGGVDSSLVVGLLAESGQDDLNTFSIGFETVGGEVGSEFPYSDVVAERFGTRHHKIEVESSRALSSLGECVAAMSEPMVSHDCIGFYLLSEEVSRHVKVVESGQGADEVLAGYDWYPPLMQSDRAVDDYASVFFDREHSEFVEAINPRFVNGDSSRTFVEDHFSNIKAARTIDKALHLDTTVMLVDDPVKRVDNMTMAFGLEARVPFLDHELVELCARIPPRHKVSNGGKYVLKQFARSVIPEEVIDRPKGYFPVPALKYLRGEYLEFVRDVLHQPSAQSRELFNPAYVAALMEQPDAHITPLKGSKLWQVALLESWFQTHGI